MLGSCNYNMRIEQKHESDVQKWLNESAQTSGAVSYASDCPWELAIWLNVYFNEKLFGKNSLRCKYCYFYMIYL